jgi:hypothetical protein
MHMCPESSNDQGELFMKQLHYILIIPCFLFSLYAFGDDYLLKPQTQGDVTFVAAALVRTSVMPCKP